MTIFKRKAVALVALAPALALALATPAHAAEPSNPGATPAGHAVADTRAKPASCGTLLLCLYTGDSYSGRRQDQLRRAAGTCDGVLYNDQLSSVWNGSGMNVRFYNDAGCTGGGAFTVTNGTGVPLMTFSHPTSVDETTSFKWLNP